MIIDAHIHSSGGETSADVLRTLDSAGVDQAVVLAPFLTPPYSLTNREQIINANNFITKLAEGHEDRIKAFIISNPQLPLAAEDLKRAAASPGVAGLKLVPSGWYPYDDCAHVIYETALAYQLPILFHSGIFIDGRSGRYCRPSFFEAVRDHPGLKVTLAHLGWPWTDEAIAVGLIDCIHDLPLNERQFRFDISFGAPPAYRLDCLRKAIETIGCDMLQFGSDRFLPCDAEALQRAQMDVHDLLDQLNANAQDRDALMGGTAAKWLAR